MLKEILESAKNLGYVYIKKIGGKDIDKRIEELEDEISWELPKFDGDVLGDLVEKLQEYIADDLEKKGLLKKGFGTIAAGLKYIDYDYKKGYKFKVEYVEIFDEEGENRQGTMKEFNEFLDFLENCKEIELDIQDEFPYEWEIVYGLKALKCYPQFPMDE